MRPTYVVLTALAAAICFLTLLSACGGGGGGGNDRPANIVQTPPPPPPEPTTDERLRTIINTLGLTGDPTAGRNLPEITDPIAQLGKKLFFSKSLSGDLDTACASCHHPALGGGDGLALPIGTGAIDPDVVGPGRSRADGLPNVGRHSQSVFNVGLLDAGLFFDSRIESLGKEAGQNGAGSGIRTPDSSFGEADPAAGSSLPAAQARFPVTVEGEMRGSLMPGATNAEVRIHLAERLGDYGAGTGALGNNNWLNEFQLAFNSAESAENLVTFSNIALALAEYQRSMVFVDNDWRAYVEGDTAAISDDAKEGAILFFTEAADGGAGCAECHSGDRFTDELHTTIAFPQIGIGKGDGAQGDDDFGRERQSGVPEERYQFRTPTLLNISATAPYSHSGVYNFAESVNHYAVPQVIFDNFLTAGGTCAVPQFADHPDCATLFPRLEQFFDEQLAKVLEEQSSAPEQTFPDIGHLEQSDFPLIRSFMRTLTDPCVLDRACLAPWIPDPGEAPDDHQLNAVNGDGVSL